MKSKFFIFLFLLVVGNGFSQNTIALQTATKKLFEANYLMDFDQIVSLSYPKMVETIGKEVLIDKLEKEYENEEYRLRYQLETVPFIMHKTQTIGVQTFCVITCRNPVRYFFEKKLSPEEAVAKTTWLQETNKTKEVTFEPKRNSFNVRRTTTYVAIMDETTNGSSKFFNLDDANQLASFEALFDESVRKELGL
jgi:hypothetical protein